jgi:hypothetical protein
MIAGSRSRAIAAIRALLAASFTALVGLVLGAARPAAARDSRTPPSTTIVKGPYLTGLSAHAVTVRFELSAARPATLQVFRDAEPSHPTGSVVGSVVVAPGTSKLQVATVNNLQPSTAYSYSAQVGGVVLAQGRFRTAPPDDSSGPLTFLVYGDSRSDPAAHASVVHGLMQVPSDFLVNTGDLVQSGSDADDWQSFFDVEAPLLRDRALFTSIGNHELYHDSSGANFIHYLGFPNPGSPAPYATAYGTARLGNVRFFFINSMDDWDTGEERQWLERELTKADAEPSLVWRIVVAHAGPWSVGPHGPNEKLVNARIPELLAQHQVDLLLSGHDHLYARGDAGRVKYIVSGGGGAPLYSVVSHPPTSRRAESAYHFVEVTTDGDSLRIVARRPDGEELDRCGMVKGGPWDCDSGTSAPGGASHAATETTATAGARIAPSSLAASPEPMAPAAAARSSRACGISLRGAGLAGDMPRMLAPLLPVMGFIAAVLVRRATRRG